MRFLVRLHPAKGHTPQSQAAFRRLAWRVSGDKMGMRRTGDGRAGGWNAGFTPEQGRRQREEWIQWKKIFRRQTANGRQRTGKRQSEPHKQTARDCG